MNPIGGAAETLKTLENAFGSDCSVSPDGKWLVYTRHIRAGHDLALLDAVE